MKNGFLRMEAESKDFWSSKIFRTVCQKVVTPDMRYFARFGTILYHSKNVKNTHGGVFFVFFTFLKLYKSYQITQHITYRLICINAISAVKKVHILDTRPFQSGNRCHATGLVKETNENIVFLYSQCYQECSKMSRWTK